MFVLNGPPDAVVVIDCQDIYVPMQIWYYERLEILKSKAYLIFYEPYGSPAIQALAADRRGRASCWSASEPGGGRAGPADVTRCFEPRTVQQAIQYTTALLGGGAFGSWHEPKMFAPPVVETEGVDQILSMTTDLHDGAADLPSASSSASPSMRANKMGMDLSLLVPKAELEAARPRRGELLQRGRHRRGRQGRPAHRQLQVPVRHPHGRDRRREDPADRAALPLSGLSTSSS